MVRRESGKSAIRIILEISHLPFTLNQSLLEIEQHYPFITYKASSTTRMDYRENFRKILLDALCTRRAHERDDQLTISEIACQVGFKSPVYFSQTNKETFGEGKSENKPSATISKTPATISKV
mgnify:CR=1 FL=1